MRKRSFAYVVPGSYSGIFLYGLHLQNASALWLVSLPPGPKPLLSVSSPGSQEPLNFSCCFVCPSTHFIPNIASACILRKHMLDHIIPLFNNPPSHSEWDPGPYNTLPGLIRFSLSVPSPTASPDMLLPGRSSSLPGDVAHLRWLCDLRLICHEQVFSLQYDFHCL